MIYRSIRNILSSVWIVIVLSVLLSQSGCVTVDQQHPDPVTYQSKKMRQETIPTVPKSVYSISFDQMTLSEAMEILSRETGVSIFVSTEASLLTIDSTFEDMPVDTIIRLCARMCDVDVIRMKEVYYLGTLSQMDVYNHVFSASPFGANEFASVVRPLLSSVGSVHSIGDSVVVSDHPFYLEKIKEIYSSLSYDLSRSYIAEVFFLRLKDSDFIQLSADLEFNQVDLFSDSFHMEELFKYCLDSDLGSSNNSVDQRPVIYLTEGQVNTFNVGSEIVKEKYNYSEGVSTVNGYEKFQDGMTLVMCAQRLDEEKILVDFDLTISTFDVSDKSEIPKSDKSELTSDGMICRDGRVHYIGSLKKSGHTRRLGLLSLDGERSSDIITIWLRIREVQ